MGKVKAYFMERMETDPEFRRDAELAELRQADPELPELNEDDEMGGSGRDRAKETCVETLF